MRSSSYAPQTAEALIETIPISGILITSGKTCWNWKKTARLLKPVSGPTACLKKWAWSLADSS